MYNFGQKQKSLPKEALCQKRSELLLARRYGFFS